jgi:hypothetical protein
VIIAQLQFHPNKTLDLNPYIKPVTPINPPIFDTGGSLMILPTQICEIFTSPMLIALHLNNSSQNVNECATTPFITLPKETT